MDCGDKNTSQNYYLMLQAYTRELHHFCARQTRLKQINKIFKFIDQNIAEMKQVSSDCYPLIGENLEAYLYTLRVYEKNQKINYDKLETCADTYYTKIKNSQAFAEMKRIYSELHTSDSMKELREIESTLINLSHRKCRRTSRSYGPEVISLYKKFNDLLQVVPVTIQNVHIIKNVALFLKEHSFLLHAYYGSSFPEALHDEIMNHPNVVEPLAAYKEFYLKK